MRRTAQYKVVDDIAHKFKLYTWYLEGYQEMIITFPQTSEEIAREKQKSEKRKQRRQTQKG